ncbi:MAG: hypothetical protein KTR31_26420 [Myxococcales bacterium]|nr:hypothetical protein [Myxococcales bacterium]
MILFVWMACASPPTEPAPQGLVVPRTEELWHTAEGNGVRYRLEVALPRSHPSGGPYPLVVLLDTHYSLLIARNVAEHLAERDHLPELVLVGVGYEGSTERSSDAYRLNRTRDYTPTHVPDGGYGPEIQQHSGGADAFAAVLQRELLPLLAERYPLSDSRTLVGHSFGGLFALHTKLQAPEAFTNVIAVSPSLWYDAHHLFEVELRHAAAEQPLAGRVYLGVGSRERNDRIDMVADLTRFAAQLERHRYEGLALEHAVLDGETHNSVFPRGLSNGLRFVFEAP